MEIHLSACLGTGACTKSEKLQLQQLWKSGSAICQEEKREVRFNFQLLIVSRGWS